MAELLDRWGQIALHLGVSEKTAIRYKESKGLPVKYDPAGHPITTKEQLDRWKLQEPQQNA